MDRASDAEAVINVVERLSAPHTLRFTDPDGEEVRVVAVPKGFELAPVKPYLDEYRTRPERAKGCSIHTTLASFIEHVLRTKDRQSVIFAHDSTQQPRLLAVYDYNEERVLDPEGEPMDGEWARHGDHRARYDFPLSDEWKAWRAQDGQPFDQTAFAEFLEDRIGDVLDPAAAGETVKGFAESLGLAMAGPQKLMELSRGISVHAEHKVASHNNLQTGERRVTFEETHKDESGEVLTVPGGFALAIPVFRGGDAYQVSARLRYRVRNGSITWSYALHRTDRFFQHAFDGACEAAREQTGLPVFCGSPEGTR